MLPDEEKTGQHRQALGVDVERPWPFGERRHPQLLQENRDAQVVANEIVLRVQHGGSEEVEDVGGQI
ncbi:hypothetical protein E2320_006153 [Naja naja]|nr:hypothetical protein E2320_006153 [Naja naja]